MPAAKSTTRKRGWTSRLKENIRNLAPEVSSLSHYDLQEKIGEGGMGVIFRAVDRRLQRTVAVKILKESTQAHETARKRFHREAQAAARISHPNVVSLHDVGEAAGCLFLVMELIEGKSLATTLVEDKPPLQRKIVWIEKVARGLSAAHQKGIIHRDLKPANILITPEGEPKIGDFGVAHIVGSESALTRTGATLGTPVYMAPEQVKGEAKAIGPQTDIYALGAILYECATRRPPHVGDTVMEIYGKIMHDEPVAPRKRNPSIPRDLQTVILKAIEKEPSRRYASADAFADDLLRFLNGEAVLAQPPTLTTRIWRKVMKRGPLVPLAAAALLIGLTLSSVMMLRSAEAAKERKGSLAKAQALEKAGKVEEAFALYESLLHSDAGDVTAREGTDRTGVLVKAKVAALNAQNEAYALLETGRQALEKTETCLYSAEADYDDVLKKVAAGRAILQQAVEKSPHLPLAHDLLARSWAFEGWDDKAEASWREALRLQPDYAPAHFHLGRTLLTRAIVVKLGRNQKDAQRYQASMDALLKEAESAMDSAIAGGADLDDDLQRLLASTIRAWAANGGDEVRRQAAEGIRRFSGEHGAEYFHVFAALAAGTVGDHFRESLSSLDRAIAIRPKFPLALFIRGNLRRQNGDLKQALADFDATLRYHPRFAWAWINRGGIRTALGDADGAIADYTESIRIEEQPEAFYNRANSLRDQGHLDEALRDFDRAIELDPKYSDAYNNRGNVRHNRGDRRGALSDFAMAIELNPAAKRAYLNRGSLKHAQGDVKGAIEDYDRAIEIDPDFADAWFNRGNAHISGGDFKTALEDYAEVLRINPRDVTSHLQRAMILGREMKDFDGALEECAHALAIDSQSPEAYLMRAQVRQAAGDFVHAVEDFAEALEVASEDWRYRPQVEQLLSRARQKCAGREADGQHSPQP